MKRALIIFIGILTLLGCKEQIAKFIFDASKMSNQTKYSYKFDSGKLSNQIETFYTIMFGQAVDTMITQTDFKYNDKGLLIKEISRTNFKEKPTIKSYNYNENDSLVGELLITPENDTIFWEIYEYYPDGRKTIFHRYLIMHFEEELQLMKKEEHIKYDTFSYRNEYAYADNLCKTQRQFDKNGDLTKIVNFHYNGNNQLIKETQLTYFNEIEVTNKIKFYDYSKSTQKPDFYSLDTKGDTIEKSQKIFFNDILLETIEKYDYGNFEVTYYYEDDNMIGEVSGDNASGIRRVFSNEYYDNGKLKATNSYQERIKYAP